VPSPKWICYIGLSLTSYFFSFIAYYAALKHFDISKISPIMMSSVVSLVAFYGFAVGERFTLIKLIGIIFGIASIVILSRA
jgi:drug/metabolite transporter (DMT)-like permease